jgi:predicted amidohydrolase
VLAEAGDDEQVLTVDFDPAEVGKAREEFPVLRDRLLGIPAPVQR